MSVLDYYNQIAQNYDQSRFANSYGQYLDRCERMILDQWLAPYSSHDVVDFGCGTGRLLNYAMTGIDGSVEMLAVASQKYPDRQLIQADLTTIAELEMKCTAGLCFHVMMHLQPSDIQGFLKRAATLIRPGGSLIVDFMSAPRRRLLGKHKQGWHGNTALNLIEIAQLAEPNWKIKQWRGLLMLPIHRLPSFMRPAVAWLDRLLCRTWLAPYASYYVVQLERRA